jgi:hypothetical protein
MIERDLAKQLKRAGLVWQPAEGDSFIIPDRGLDDQVYVVNHLTTLIQEYHGDRMVTFHGTSEWALDNVLVADVIWLPSETQLRELISERIGPDAPLRLDRLAYGYRCQLANQDEMLEFDAPTAENAYGMALLRLLQSPN